MGFVFRTPFTTRNRCIRGAFHSHRFLHDFLQGFTTEICDCTPQGTGAAHVRQSGNILKGRNQVVLLQKNSQGVPTGPEQGIHVACKAKVKIKKEDF